MGHIDGQEHTHGHEHAGPHTHPHTHEAGHGDDHSRAHVHEHGEMGGAERTRALLAYLIDHNDHHADELAELLETLDGAARKKMLEAIGSFEVANTQLREVLSLMEK